MKKPTVKYSKGEIGRVRIVEDFLPSPDRPRMSEATSGTNVTPPRIWLRSSGLRSLNARLRRISLRSSRLRLLFRLRSGHSLTKVL
jgi:hypothetical protein